MSEIIVPANAEVPSAPITAPDSVMLGQLRQLLSALGGIAVAAGFLNTEQLGPLINAVVTIFGSAMVLGAMVLSWMNKRKLSKVIQTAANAPTGTSVAAIQAAVKASP
jgi:hypothetical protein